MSSFDAMLTTVPEDVREAIEEVCNEAGTFDADWCILKAAGELIAKSRTIPRVSPEDLVEGEWYYCVKRDWQGFGKAANDSWCNKPTGTMAIWIGDTDWSPQCFDSIYGPLRFKIGGA